MTATLKAFTFYYTFTRLLLCQHKFITIQNHRTIDALVKCFKRILWIYYIFVLVVSQLNLLALTYKITWCLCLQIVDSWQYIFNLVMVILKLIWLIQEGKILCIGKTMADYVRNTCDDKETLSPFDCHGISRSLYGNAVSKMFLYPLMHIHQN